MRGSLSPILPQPPMRCIRYASSERPDIDAAVCALSNACEGAGTVAAALLLEARASAQPRRRVVLAPRRRARLGLTKVTSHVV